MSKYLKLVQECKLQLRAAVIAYEAAIIRKGSAISAIRAQDILQLEALWADCDDGIKLRQDTLQVCKNLKVGWLWRSDLRSKIMQVISLSIYSDYNFCLCLKADYDLMKSRINLITTTTNQSTPEKIQLENIKLKQQNRQLLDEISTLKTILTNIQQANSNLATQVQNLHLRIIKLERQEPNEPLSPSSEVLNSFRELAGK